MGNSAEELYRRSAIGEGCKIICDDINSCGRTIGVLVRQRNATQRMPPSVATEAVLRKDLCKTSGDIMDLEKREGAVWKFQMCQEKEGCD